MQLDHKNLISTDGGQSKNFCNLDIILIKDTYNTIIQ